MSTVKTIAIIGATGTIGSSIARKLSQYSSNRLLLMGSSIEKLMALYSEIIHAEAKAAVDYIKCPKEASWVATGKIVISISDPLNDDLSGSVLTPNISELQKLLPNSKVIKAFDTDFAADFANPMIEESLIESFVNEKDARGLQNDKWYAGFAIQKNQLN